MSYARNNGTDSEVYVIKVIDGSLECLGCRLTSAEFVPEQTYSPKTTIASHWAYGTFYALDAEHMLAHLKAHRAAAWLARAFKGQIESKEQS